jgi:hypothetical protein
MWQKAIAGEAGVPFYQMAGSEFVEVLGVPIFVTCSSMLRFSKLISSFLLFPGYLFLVGPLPS